MNAELISIGDEILIGQVVNTNAAFLAEELSKLGISVIRITSVPDKAGHILSSIDEAVSRADLIITTGGLGPTSDDITKESLAEYFDSEIILFPDVMERNKILLRSRGVTMNKKNTMQAMLPDNCEILPNKYGTAQGMWLIKNNTVCCALPGVPYEMKGIFLNELAPRLKNRFALPVIHHKTILTSGLPESEMAQIIEDWEKDLPKHIKLAYLPSPGLLRLRLTGTADKTEGLINQIDKETEKLKSLIGPFVFGYNEDKLEQLIGRLLLGKNMTMALAESCTGGKVSELITSVPGCSDYYKGSIVAYSNDIKISDLNVSSYHLKKHGAVSEEVAIEMAQGVLRSFKSDISMAITGIAGPSGGSDSKPVGTTWIAVASKRNVTSRLYHFGEHRGRNILKASITALFMLKKELEAWS